MIIAILMGRKGSVGFPGKNLQPVLGRPLMVYPLLAGLHAQSVDRVYISTDDERIMAIGQEYGARVIVRPPELATKEALGEHVYVHAQQVAKAELAAESKELELTVLLMCNAPTVLATTIDQGVAVLRAHPDYDSAVTVSCYNMWSPLRARKAGESGLLHPFVPFETFGDPKTLNCDRDSQGDVWFADMGLSVIRPGNLDRLEEGQLPQKWMGRNIYGLKQWGGLDVDYAYQLPQAEYWLKAHGFSETETPYEG